MTELERRLCGRFGNRLQTGRPLADLTSFGIGGPADLLLVVEEVAELVFALCAADQAGVPAFCLGAGTNLLVSDRGVRGLVLRLGRTFQQLRIDGSRLIAGAAAPFGRVVETAVAAGLGGLEFGEGIPGSVGGALVMNAGAFGGELAQVVRRVEGVTRAGVELALERAQAGFAYRKSGLPGGFVVTAAEFELTPADPASLRERVAVLRARRQARQPSGLPNAGSVFKNPPGQFAGRLLEAVGLKGYRLGRAAFSDRHANFIVNLGGARASEVRELVGLASRRVKDRFDVSLEPELKMVGDWSD